MINTAFIVHVFCEKKDDVEITISKIKNFYPNSPVFIIYDGVQRHFHLGTIEKEMCRVKIPGNFGEFTHRYLNVFLDETNCDYVIKIDPDTKVWKKILNLPDPTLPITFCRMSSDGIPHGGAIGYTRPMAKLLVNSGCFIDSQLLKIHQNHAQQDSMYKEIIGLKKLHVQVRRDFGWIGKENDSTVFSHSGHFGEYSPDLNVPYNKL